LIIGIRSGNNEVLENDPPQNITFTEVEYGGERYTVWVDRFSKKPFAVTPIEK